MLINKIKNMFINHKIIFVIAVLCLIEALSIIINDSNKNMTPSNLGVNENINDMVLSYDCLQDNLTELGMSSMQFVRIIVALEEEFDCEIPDEKLLITEMDTVQKMVDVLQSIYDNQGE